MCACVLAFGDGTIILVQAREVIMARRARLDPSHTNATFSFQPTFYTQLDSYYSKQIFIYCFVMGTFIKQTKTSSQASVMR